MKFLSKIDIFVIKRRIEDLNNNLYHYEQAVENIRYLESKLEKDLDLIENEMREAK